MIREGRLHVLPAIHASRIKYIPKIAGVLENAAYRLRGTRAWKHVMDKATFPVLAIKHVDRTNIKLNVYKSFIGC